MHASSGDLVSGVTLQDIFRHGHIRDCDLKKRQRMMKSKFFLLLKAQCGSWEVLCPCQQEWLALTATHQRVHKVLGFFFSKTTCFCGWGSALWQTNTFLAIPQSLAFGKHPWPVLSGLMTCLPASCSRPPRGCRKEHLAGAQVNPDLGF